MSLLISLKCAVLFYSHSPFSLWSHLNMRVVKLGQGKDNRRIRTKAENALKLSRIPQKSLLYLASTLNITASYIDKERILLKIWLSHINTFTKHQINVWQVWKRICFFFLNPPPFTACLLMLETLKLSSLQYSVGWQNVRILSSWFVCSCDTQQHGVWMWSVYIYIYSYHVPHLEHLSSLPTNMHTFKGGIYKENMHTYTHIWHH